MNWYYFATITAAAAAIPILIILTSSDVYAFVEDYIHRPTDNGIQLILVYCFGNPNENNTRVLVEKGIISPFYTGYTCNKTSSEHPELLESAAEVYDQIVNLQKQLQSR